jgi:hypothetical protein
VTVFLAWIGAVVLGVAALAGLLWLIGRGMKPGDLP